MDTSRITGSAEWCLHSCYSFFLSSCRRKPALGLGPMILDPTAEVLIKYPLVCLWGCRMQPRGQGTKGMDMERIHQRGLQLCAWWESSMSAWSWWEYQGKRQPNPPPRLCWGFAHPAPPSVGCKHRVAANTVGGDTRSYQTEFTDIWPVIFIPATTPFNSSKVHIGLPSAL